MFVLAEEVGSAEAPDQLPGRVARVWPSSLKADCRLQQYWQIREPDCCTWYAIDRLLEHGVARSPRWHCAFVRDTHSGCGHPGSTLPLLELRLLASGIRCARRRCICRRLGDYVHSCRAARSGRLFAGRLLL